jgi:hypothetical protein
VQKRTGVDGKLLSGTLYGMYAVTLNELKAALKLCTQAGQRSAVNETSVESTAQDEDSWEAKRRKISSDTSQTAKNSTKPVPTYLQLLHTSQNY